MPQFCNIEAINQGVKKMKYPELESHTLEFKSVLPQNDQVIKTVIGFCNQAGGRLILGVDNEGGIIGIGEDEAMQVMESLEYTIYQATTPPIIPKILLQRIGDKLILVIKVSSGMNKPYYKKSEGLERGTYIRVGRSTLRATADMIEELRWQGRGLSFDVMPVYQASLDELDSGKIEKFLERKTKETQISLTEELLKAYKLIAEEHAHVYPSVCGILLFGKKVDYRFSEAMIICTHFAGVSGREAIATRDCTGTLFEQFANAYEFILNQINRSFSIQGPKREERFEVPEIAIRELLLNALVHRNYHLRAPIKVAIYQDRIEIFSPGGFPTPFSSVKLGLTDVRNMAICRVFREAGYIEKLGTGILTAFEAYEKWGLPEPTIIDGENFVKCILPRGSYGTLLVSDDLQPILKLFTTADELAVSDVMKALHMPRATATRRLNELVNKEALIKVGRGKGTRYKKRLKKMG
ncbi:MAG: hypothetical protein FJZ63_07300 [Chlamydiae bacterium]|nr:hypothetical protein [Chlamydiota bacterium]